jgi:hypothetical protein
MTLTPALSLEGRGGFLKGETFPRVPLVRMGGLAPPVATFFRPAGACTRAGSGPALALAALIAPSLALPVRTESCRPGARDEPGGGVVRSLTVAARIDPALARGVRKDPAP